MAAAITEKLFPRRIYVRSCGVREGEPDPFVEAVMAEIGCDLASHRPKTFEMLDESGFDLVVTATSKEGWGEAPAHPPARGPRVA